MIMIHHTVITHQGRGVMSAHRFRSVINIVCFVLVLSVNYLATALPINGVTQKELSEEYQIFLTPSGYVFAIWGLIYLGLSAYITVQALPKWLDDDRIRGLDVPFVISSVCNALWLIVWHYRYLAMSVVLMLGLLSSLIWGYTRLANNRTISASSSLWFVDRTFGVYLGWVGLATILNLSIWFDYLGWTGTPLTGPMWASVMLMVACSLYLYLSFSLKDAAIVGVLAWASLGIALKNQAEQLVWITGLLVCLISLVAFVKIGLSGRSKQLTDA